MSTIGQTDKERLEELEVLLKNVNGEILESKNRFNSKAGNKAYCGYHHLLRSYRKGLKSLAFDIRTDIDSLKEDINKK